MKIDFSFQIKNSNGDVLYAGIAAAKIICENLENSSSSNPVKLAMWAFKINETKELELDEENIRLFEKEIEGWRIPVVIRAAILNEIQKTKEIAKVK